MTAEYYNSLTDDQRKFADFVLMKYAQAKEGYARHQGKRDPVLQIADKAVNGHKVRLGPNVYWTDEQKELVRWLLGLHHYSPVWMPGPHIVSDDSPSSQDPVIADYEKRHSLKGRYNCAGGEAIVQILVYQTVFGDYNSHGGDPWGMIQTIYDQVDRSNPLSWLHWGRNTREGFAYRFVFDMPGMHSYSQVHDRYSTHK